MAMPLNCPHAVALLQRSQRPVLGEFMRIAERPLLEAYGCFPQLPGGPLLRIAAVRAAPFPAHTFDITPLGSTALPHSRHSEYPGPLRVVRRLPGVCRGVASEDDPRAGVAQASREETAGHAVKRGAGRAAMAIRAAAAAAQVVRWRSVGTPRGAGGGAAMPGRAGRRFRRALASVFARHGQADPASTLTSMDRAWEGR
jgi:hypothetical protein